MDQRGQRLHVVALEGGDVAFEQRATGVVELVHGRGRVGLGQGGPGALERAVHRGDARVEELRDLGRLPAEHFAEHERRTLARR